MCACKLSRRGVRNHTLPCSRFDKSTICIASNERGLPERTSCPLRTSSRLCWLTAAEKKACQEWTPHSAKSAAYMSNVELLRELVENRTVTVLVLLDDGGDERDQLVPELEVVEPRSSVLVLLPALASLGLRLELGVVEVVAVAEQEGVGGPQARLHPVPDHGAGSVRGGELLDLHPEEGDGGQEVHCGLEVLQLLWVAGGEVVSVHGEVYPQAVVEGVEQLDKLVFLQEKTFLEILF